MIFIETNEYKIYKARWFNYKDLYKEDKNSSMDISMGKLVISMHPDCPYRNKIEMPIVISENGKIIEVTEIINYWEE